MRCATSVLLLAALGFHSSGCAAGAPVPDQDRLRVTQEIAGRKRWLKVALNVGPFFGDAGKLLASDQPFSELELLETPGGRPIAPPRAERVLPPGLPVTVREVEFPTPWLAARRVLMTPRTQAWVYLEVPGEARPAILVLPPTATTFEEVRLELERTLATFDTAPQLAALSDGQRRAVERKEPLEGMNGQAVTMAWGYPEKKIVDRPAGKEQWIWPGGKRRAWLEDDRLVRFEGR